MTLSEWMHAIIVRPFGEFIPSLLKRVYEALELEDVKIDLDLDHYSKSKAKVASSQHSKKRKHGEVATSLTYAMSE
jgi:hypothetical protein